MTTAERMQKQRAFHSHQYAMKLYRDESGLMMADFKHRASIYGEEWKLKIWGLRNLIKRGG